MKTDMALVDQIYEAAFIPEYWETVCDRLSAEVNGFSTSLITVSDKQSYRWISSPCVQEAMEQFSKSPLRFQNIRPQRHLQRSPFSFLRDTDLMTEEEIDSDPIYNEFMRPRGLGWTVGDLILEPSGHMIIFDIIRQTKSGPFDDNDVAKLNRLRPDLARAALMSSRLAFQQAQTVAQTLSSVGLPAAVIDSGRCVIALNPEFEALSHILHIGSRDRLSIVNIAANVLFAETMEQLRLGLPPTVRTIPVATDGESQAVILHVLPVKRDARDVFTKSAAVLVATIVGHVGPPDLRVLCGLFDLTAGEARVAREIATGSTVDDTARKLGLARETVRTYLKLIFNKTGTAKQSQLVLLLSGLGSPR